MAIIKVKNRNVDSEDRVEVTERVSYIVEYPFPLDLFCKALERWVEETGAEDAVIEEAYDAWGDDGYGDDFLVLHGWTQPDEEFKKEIAKRREALKQQAKKAAEKRKAAAEKRATKERDEYERLRAKFEAT